VFYIVKSKSLGKAAGTLRSALSRPLQQEAMLRQSSHVSLLVGLVLIFGVPNSFHQHPIM